MKSIVPKEVLALFVLTVSALMLGFCVGRLTSTSTRVVDASPIEARAEADARAWLLTHETPVLRLRRNAVVFNWTAVPSGQRPQPGWAFSEWYLARDDGSLKLAGLQRLSGLGG